MSPRVLAGACLLPGRRGPAASRDATCGKPPKQEPFTAVTQGPTCQLELQKLGH
jgi:hypothetical protein